MKGGPLPFREELIGSRFEALGRRVLDGMVVLYWRILRRVA